MSEPVFGGLGVAVGFGVDEVLGVVVAVGFGVVVAVAVGVGVTVVDPLYVLLNATLSVFAVSPTALIVWEIVNPAACVPITQKDNS